MAAWTMAPATVEFDGAAGAVGDGVRDHGGELAADAIGLVGDFDPEIGRHGREHRRA